MNNFKEGNNQKDQALLRFAICNIAQELMGKHGPADILVTEEDEMAAVMQFPDSNICEEFILTLVECQEAIKVHYNFTISISIGGIVSSISEISHSYRTAREYIKYRLFYGHECIIDISNVIDYMDNNAKYPNMIEGKLIDAMQLGNKEHIQKAIREFIQYVDSSKSYYQTVIYANQLLLCVFRTFESILGLSDEDFKNHLDGIGHAETISEIEEGITRFCLKIYEQSSERNNRLITRKHRQAIDDVQEYIRKNYSNPVLSLEIAADFAALSPGYLRKLFKDMANTSFSDYLNSVRLEKAKELMLTTNDPISKICEKIGILNITYFSTMFRKENGVTPSQYRSMNGLTNQ